MTPDDPRHGTVAGYNRIPCREECCKTAMSRYKKRWEWDRANGRHRITSTIGTRRRIESLAWLGWSRAEIAKRAGMHATNMTRLLSGATMTVALAARFAVIYDELCMTLPTGNTQAIANVRNRARARGAVPPLAWDNIDDPDETPTVGAAPHMVDEEVVRRLLEGKRLDSTADEKREAMRRWLKAGKSERSLCEMHGWRMGRYTERSAA